MRRWIPPFIAPIAATMLSALVGTHLARPALLRKLTARGVSISGIRFRLGSCTEGGPRPVRRVKNRYGSSARPRGATRGPAGTLGSTAPSAPAENRVVRASAFSVWSFSKYQHPRRRWEPESPDASPRSGKPQGCAPRALWACPPAPAPAGVGRTCGPPYREKLDAGSSLRIRQPRPRHAPQGPQGRPERRPDTAATRPPA